MRIAYCDCFSGISGDMFLAALLDAGLPLDELRSQLARLPFEETWQIEAQKVMKGPLQATQINILTGESHHHRHLSEISDLIVDSGLDGAIQAVALSIFQKLAEAEGKVHGLPPEQVHFHEVGAVDSILDITGAAIGLHQLGITRLYASPLPLGGGTVQTQHGPLPLPAPATLELLRQANAPLVSSAAQVELVTPTGAALLASLATFEQPELRLQTVGIGAGKRDLPWPNVLRLLVGETVEAQAGAYSLIETNIDDMNPQFFGSVMERLFAAGALDVFFTPIQMKKNRPASMLSVIARKSDEPTLADILLRETTTFGVRVQPVYRYEAGRTITSVQTPYGEVQVKLKLLGGERIQAAPEYDACARLAESQHVPVWEVYQAALKAAQSTPQPAPGGP